MTRRLFALFVSIAFACLAQADAPAPAADEKPTAYTAEDVRIHQYGDTAVVAFRLAGTTGSGDKATVAYYLNTGTFVERNGEWRAVACSRRRCRKQQANDEWNA